jgi:hypothetical protein
MTYGGNVKSRNTKTAGSSGDADELIKDNVRLFLITALVHCLVADSIDSAVNHLSTIELDDLVYGVTLGEVNALTADLLCSIQSLLDLIHNVDLTGSTKDGRVGGHQTYGTSTKDCDAVTGLETRELETVPAGREDISEKSKVGLVLGTRR